MGIKCGFCGCDNGITMYHDKKCKKCGALLRTKDELIEMIDKFALSKTSEVKE